MAYQLWLDDYQDVLTYYRKKQGKYYLDCKKCEPLQFNSKNKLKKFFSIKEIDSLTCSYQSEAAFLADLKKYGFSYFQDDSKDHLFLTYENKSGYIKQEEILYNNKLLRYYAIASRNISTLAPTNQLYEFIEYIKTLALNTTTSPYLLSPGKIADLSSDEKASLKKSLPQDISSKGHIIKLSLISYLKQYRDLSLQYKDLDSTLEVDCELDFINKKIYSCFTESYQNLRQMMIWEKKYQEILKKKMQDSTDDAKKVVLKSQLDQVQTQQNYRNGVEDKRSSSKVLSLEEAQASIMISDNAYNQYTTIQNEFMMELFKKGGIEAVMENMSVDDIYNNIEDAKRLGILPKDYDGSSVIKK